MTTRPLARVAAVVAALCLGLVGALVATSPASAAAYTVINGSDTGTGSLNEAIADANSNAGPDAITITFAGTITLTTPLPGIIGDTTITSAVGTIVDGAGTPGGTRGLDHQSCGTTLSVTGVSLRDFPDDGIYSSCGALSLNSVGVASSGGSGLRAYGGGTVSVVGSSFTSNGSMGLFVSGDQMGMQTTITTVTATLNGVSGVRVDSSATGTTATLTGITATGNGASGIQLGSNPGVISLSGATSTGNLANGIDVDAHGALGPSSITVSGLTASSNSGQGVYSPLMDSGGALTITDTTANSNGLTNFQFDSVNGAGSKVALTRVAGNSSASNLGLYLDVLNAATVEITDSQFNDNNIGGAFVSADGSPTVTVTRTQFARNNLLNVSTAGGLIANISNSATLTLDACSLIDNRGQFGGGAYLSPTSGAVNILRSTISGNTVTGSPAWGGGLFISGLNDDDGSVLISDSTISGNTAQLGGGLTFFGSLAASGGFRLLRSTVSDNTATSDAGGIAAANWGWNVDPTLAGFSIDQSTISGNSADNGAGIAASAGPGNASPAEFEIVNSTISGNTATTEVGAVNFGASDTTSYLSIEHSTITGNTSPGVRLNSGGPMVLTHSVVADNGAIDLEQPGGGPIAIDWSLIGTADFWAAPAVASGTGNLTGVDPLLGPLADNGGPTMTHALLASSPLLDAGDPAITGEPATDQRGLARIFNVIDLGAVETQALAATGTNVSTPLLAAVSFGLCGILLLLVRRRLRT